MRIAGRTLILLIGAIILIYATDRLSSGGGPTTIVDAGIVIIKVAVMAIGFGLGRRSTP